MYQLIKLPHIIIQKKKTGEMDSRIPSIMYVTTLFMYTNTFFVYMNTPYILHTQILFNFMYMATLSVYTITFSVSMIILFVYMNILSVCTLCTGVSPCRRPLSLCTLPSSSCAGPLSLCTHVHWVTCLCQTWMLDKFPISKHTVTIIFGWFIR